MSTKPLLVLPRPDEKQVFPPPTVIPAPSESSFTNTFGTLLPPARQITTSTGTFTFYSLPPTSHPSASTPRILLLHGIQTPAIGLIPLCTGLRTIFPFTHFVLVDWWGHGLSSTPIQAHTPALFVAQLDSLLVHLAWPSAHIVAFSFGCSVAVSFAQSCPHCVLSLALVAPAGLLRSVLWGHEANAILVGERGEEAARDWILEFLEGGKLLVPEDWEDRVARGEVVAEKVREWQMREHEGHEGSVVAIFRDGGVSDRHCIFKDVVSSGVKAVVVLGGDDEICTKEDVESVGFENVKVIEGVGHGVVRQKADEVAALIADFWKSIGI